MTGYSGRKTVLKTIPESLALQRQQICGRGLACAEQERDALIREKNSLTQQAESLAQENQSLTQDKESMAQQAKKLKQEYASLKSAMDLIQDVVSPWPKTIAEILNTAKKEGFNDDPLAHEDVTAIINDINDHLITWLTGYAEHVRRFSDSSHSRGYGNGSEKIDEAALGKALKKLHENLAAETDAAASENSSEEPDSVTETVQQPDSSEQREQQTNTAEPAPKKKLTVIPAT